MPHASGNLHQRSVTIFADGAVDRSPCGSGTAARLAVLDARGELNDESVARPRLHRRIAVRGRLSSSGSRVDGADAVIPRITGMAYKTGEHVFDIDPRDPMVPGFVLR